MNVSKFCKLFPRAEQIGRFYMLPGKHARGPTFRIFLLKDGETAHGGSGVNAPLNNGKIELYGVTSGHPGWTEKYGWLEEGDWEAEIEKIIDNRECDMGNES